jgi:hypothetical protein
MLTNPLSLLKPTYEVCINLYIDKNNKREHACRKELKI